MVRVHVGGSNMTLGGLIKAYERVLFFLRYLEVTDNHLDHG